MSSDSYREAGVDTHKAADFIRDIKADVRSTQRAGADTEIGGFGGIFDLAKAGFKDPILVAATDGVGTKLKIALETGQHGTVGIDLVAMCVNDIVVQGAEPLFFLDYLATGKLITSIAKDVLAGITIGCQEAGCALIGGETAEMPGFYAAEDYDLAGFSVGAAERNSILTGSTIRPNDIVIGLASSGLHSNGFSLVRKVIQNSGIELDAPCPFGAGTLGENLLYPTKIYVQSCLAIHKTGIAKGFAHITGGGLIENIPRILPTGLSVSLNAKQWPAPPVYRWLADEGGIPAVDMAETFNCGIGMILVVAPENVEKASKLLLQNNQKSFVVGMVIESQKGQESVNIDSINSLCLG